ncbi:MAG: hypothetical protein Q4A36_00570 [Candidatus Saccharibacteria bacterium]|nr:hypothetical protein [Candidatus Saccharibacteria bacterium]
MKKTKNNFVVSCDYVLEKNDSGRLCVSKRRLHYKHPTFCKAKMSPATKTTSQNQLVPNYSQKHPISPRIVVKNTTQNPKSQNRG